MLHDEFRKLAKGLKRSGKIGSISACPLRCGGDGWERYSRVFKVNVGLETAKTEKTISGGFGGYRGYHKHCNSGEESHDSFYDTVLVAIR